MAVPPYDPERKTDLLVRQFAYRMALDRPGLSTERMALCLAEYREGDRVGEGGGVVSEHEHITVVEAPLAELAAMADRGGIADMKTFALVQTQQLRRPELFSG